MKKAVCVILFNEQGQILGVSRKEDHNDMNLIGGKVDDTDPTIEFAAIRETKEETGLDIFDLKEVHLVEYGGYEQHCFTAKYTGRIHTEENHVVKWIDPIELTKGSFGDYNLARFTELGIL